MVSGENFKEMKMELIKKLETRKTKAGKWKRWGLYKCTVCGENVERRMGGQGKTCSPRCCQLIHGDAFAGKKKRLYNIWDKIKQRCGNPNVYYYHRYGGRGISVCKEWLEYVPFKTWALANGYADNLTIDRIDNDGNYDPSNCQWITHSANVRKSNERFTMDEVVEIRKIINYGKYSKRRIAMAYNVDPHVIYNIASNKTYKEERCCC